MSSPDPTWSGQGSTDGSVSGSVIIISGILLLPLLLKFPPPIFMIMIMIMTIMTIRTKLFLLNRDTAMVPLLVSAPVQLYRYWPRHINNVNVIISIMIIIFTITELISFRRSARTHPALFLM